MNIPPKIIQYVKYNINDKNVNEAVKQLTNKQRAWLTLMKMYALNSSASELKKLENLGLNYNSVKYQGKDAINSLLQLYSTDIEKYKLILRNGAKVTKEHITLLTGMYAKSNKMIKVKFVKVLELLLKHLD